MALFSPIVIESEGSYYVSGQLSENPDDSLANQTRQCLERIRAVLAEQGLEPSSISRVGIYTTHIEDIASINTAYEAFFADTPSLPARSAFGVTSLVGGAAVEIDCFGHVPATTADSHVRA